MLLVIACVAALFFVPRGQVGTMSAVFVALGFFVYGPQMLIAVAAADFATKAASSSAVGLTGLFGYLGASLCGVATGVLADGFGWDGVLWFYAGSAVIGAVLLATTWGVRTPGR
jgi:sugar phosphate permease